MGTQSYAYNEERMMAGILAFRAEEKLKPAPPKPSMKHSMLPLPIKKIVRVTARYLVIQVDEVLSENNSRNLVRAREIVVLVLRNRYQYSTPAIGRLIGRHHTTILHAITRATDHYESDKTFREAVDFVTRRTL